MDHRGKECSMVCTDCCVPLCGVCVKGLRKGVHKEHEIDEIEDARIDMKNHLFAALETKIRALENSLALEVDRLMQESKNHAKDVDVVVRSLRHCRLGSKINFGTDSKEPSKQLKNIQRC